MNNIEFSAVWKDWLKEIAISKIATIFEPERKCIPGVRIGQARYILGRLKKAGHDTFIKFPKSYGRNTSLAGIWMFLRQEHQREYAVTVFGKRKGQGLTRPVQCCGMHISYGQRNHVQLTPVCLDYLKKHMEKVSNAEILICHNHLRNIATDILAQVIDWSPLPSNSDRKMMARFKYESIVRWLVRRDFKNIRFYIIENSRIRKILIPPIKLVGKAIMAINQMLG